MPHVPTFGHEVAVVFAFPSFKPSREILFVAKVSASIEFLRIGLVSPLHFAINLGTSWRNVTMRDSEI